MTLSSITGIRLVGAATAFYGILQHRRIANINIPRRNYTTFIEKGWPNFTYPEIDLTHIGGYDAIKDKCADIVRYFQNKEDYTKTGVKPPKGVIFSGPPGVAKSLIAEAIAGHAGVPFILVSGGELANPYVGVTEEKVRQAFQRAIEIAPCVLCFDEIESIGGRRISSELNQATAHHITSAVNQLLTLLAQNNPGVVVIGTTNKYNDLDEAVVRPGRFDTHIVIPLPSRKDRKCILEIHTKDKQLASDVSIGDLAAISSSYSGAKIAGWVNEAALLANRENSQVIHAVHFDLARTLIESGVPGQKNEDPLEIKRVATREAAKALVGHLLNLNIYKVSVLPYGGKDGITEWIQPEVRNRKQELLDDICMLLAGRAGEIISGEPSKGCKEEIKKAKDIAIEMVRDEGMGSTILGLSIDVEALLAFEMKRAETILIDNRSLWENITEALIENVELLRSDFLKVIHGEKISKKIKRWFFGSESATQKALPLPPKTIRVEESLHKSNKKEVSNLNKLVDEITSCNTAKAPNTDEFIVRGKAPFTIDELAKAIAVDVTKIRAVESQSRGGIMIVFKPSFQNSDHIERLVKKFKLLDIEAFHYVMSKKLEIEHYGVEEFIKFVKKHD